MPRFGNSSTPAGAAGSANNRNGNLKFHWSFSYEVELPNGAPSSTSHGYASRSRYYTDDLGALLDKALAFAG
jgi:hypothetical protein